MTLISQHGSDAVERRCDARCHNAEGRDCHCICGGRFHGKREGSPDLEGTVHEYAEALADCAEAQGYDVSVLREILAGRLTLQGENIPPLFAKAL